MNDNEIAKKITENSPIVRRKVGRPRSRWINVVLEDIKILKITNWWMIARNKDVLDKDLKKRPWPDLSC